MDGEIQPAALERVLHSEDAPLVVDIRDPASFARGHVPGSVNIPLAALPREIERVRGTSHVVTVCPHGKASVQAARLVASFEGFDGRVESLHGGLEAWEGPLEKTTEQPDAPF